MSAMVLRSTEYTLTLLLFSILTSSDVMEWETTQTITNNVLSTDIEETAMQRQALFNLVCLLLEQQLQSLLFFIEDLT